MATEVQIPADRTDPRRSTGPRAVAARRPEARRAQEDPADLEADVREWVDDLPGRSTRSFPKKKGPLGGGAFEDGDPCPGRGS